MLTLSSSERVAFNAPSGRPNGKQYLEKHTILKISWVLAACWLRRASKLNGDTIRTMLSEMGQVGPLLLLDKVRPSAPWLRPWCLNQIRSLTLW